jgi:hypothetical protein
MPMPPPFFTVIGNTAYYMFLHELIWRLLGQACVPAAITHERLDGLDHISAVALYRHKVIHSDGKYGA